MTTSLKLVITFRKQYLEPLKAKLSAIKFFDYYNTEHNINCEVHVSDPKNVDVDPIYKAELYEIEVEIQYNEHFLHPGDQFNKIGNEWCNPTKNILANAWLKLYDRSVLRNKGKQFHSDVDLNEIAFGTFPTMFHFMQHYHYEIKSGEREIMCTFLHNQKHFIVYTCLVHDKYCKFLKRTYKFRVEYKSISRVIINDTPNKETVQMYFILKHIPLVHIEKDENKEEPEFQSGDRVSFLASDQEYQEKKWDRALEFGCRCNRSFCVLKKVGKCPVFKVVISRKRRANGIIERLIQRCPSKTIFHYCHVEALISKLKLKDFELFPYDSEKFDKIIDKSHVADISFSCQFAWQVVLSYSLEIQDQIIMKYELEKNADQLAPWVVLKMNLIKFSRKNIDALLSALYQIAEMIVRNEIFVFEDALQKLFDHHCRHKSKLELPEGMCFVRRLIITPSRVISVSPTEHFDNRVIRKYGAENMLRVSIQDDNFSKLTFAVQFHTYKDQMLDEIALNSLRKGIEIGPRHYEMLAASNSQLREHGLWMYAQDRQGNTADTIRKWMGDFSRIRNVAKYMARMGQCFSTSEEAVQLELSNENVIELEEVKSADGKYVFSDGIGMISQDLAEEVKKDLEKHVPLRIMQLQPMYRPTAFQIRYQGCKGMVAESTTLSERRLGIRPSMKKFECENLSLLEIVKISAPRNLFLNRPLISILEQLGVKPNIFLKLQKEMVIDITDSLIYERKACKLLTNLTTLDYPYMKLLKSGICLTEEPFYRSLLHSVYRNCIDQLRSKARLAVPPEYGRNMLGVLDETFTLEYGQIFVQYSEEVGYGISPTKILQGTVVVTKNPCMHPGDVRKLEAIDVPALHHIKDCIVFPAKGKRPHPDEMAGSDLDGDEYVVIWMQDLIFPKRNYKAMDYPPNPEIKHSGSITVDDMIDFIRTYIKNDNIGVLANAHLAWADIHPEGIFSKVCMKIAEKYPMVLDFAKSGTTCHLTYQEKPKQYPDFMEKGAANNSYKSKKALGLLYRTTRNLEACVSKIDTLEQPVVPDKFLEYPGWEEYKDSADSHRKEYSKRFKNILKKYGIQNEAEALTSYVGKVNDYNENRYEKANAISISKTYLMDTIKRFRYEFFKSCDKEVQMHRIPRNEVTEYKYRRASAWYMVTYCSSDRTILSFPWIIGDVLAEMRLKLCGSKPIPRSSFIEQSDEVLLQKFEDLKNHLDGRCYCVPTMYESVREWMTKSSLTLKMTADEVFCFQCYERIKDYFMQTQQITCCSSKEDGCNCSNKCSPMKLILKFMKFYATEVCSEIGQCNAQLPNRQQCEGFRVVNLQSVALQAYASLAVTRNRSYLGFTDNSTSSSDDTIDEEGDPIRVPVTKEFSFIMTHHRDELDDLLKSLTGVKEIFITGDKDRKDNWYILVHSIGKAWQRWSLEELIMDPKSPTYFQSKLKGMES
ncbi:uncharacterized protein LOC129220635 [Uloborus diversus]|uniref:uncharacterized protein LOC129220635 n=1 Tax=Uloborus diversus TaxID=327109 RepID=UPI00240A6C25|nr:uncharacterized protein LOC129220635 [Uloborus diversus]